jgi:hypothetical protein
MKGIEQRTNSKAAVVLVEGHKIHSHGSLRLRTLRS